MNRIDVFLHLPFQLHIHLHSSCFMSNDIQLQLLACESTRCHMDIIRRRVCNKENVIIIFLHDVYFFCLGLFGGIMFCAPFFMFQPAKT